MNRDILEGSSGGSGFELEPKISKDPCDFLSEGVWKEGSARAASGG
jgi:hypothetical protein